MRKYRAYTDEDVINFAAQVTSIRALLQKLNLKEAGGNYANMQRIIQRLDIDTSHWTGRGWNAGKQLKDWSDYTRSAYLKPHLIKDRGHICENCKLSEWCEQMIKLEIHHIDGDRTHNNPSNLQLLCPNCHSLTKSWRKPNFSPKDMI